MLAKEEDEEKNCDWDVDQDGHQPYSRGLRVYPGTGACQNGGRLPSLPHSLRIVEARKLEHGFRRISARIPYTLP